MFIATGRVFINRAKINFYQLFNENPTANEIQELAIMGQPIGNNPHVGEAERETWG